VLQLSDTLENGFIGLIISLVGTYFIAIWKGADGLDAAHHAESANLRQQITQLTPAKRTPSQEHAHDKAEAALDMVGPDAITVLRHLNDHGTLTFMAVPGSGMPVAQSQTPEGMDSNATYMCLEKCAFKSLVSSNRRTVYLSPNHINPVIYIDYRIAKGMKEALVELLYPPTVQQP